MAKLVSGIFVLFACIATPSFANVIRGDIAHSGAAVATNRPFGFFVDPGAGSPVSKVDRNRNNLPSHLEIASGTQTVAQGVSSCRAETEDDALATFPPRPTRPDAGTLGVLAFGGLFLRAPSRRARVAA